MGQPFAVKKQSDLIFARSWEGTAIHAKQHSYFRYAVHKGNRHAVHVDFLFGFQVPDAHIDSCNM
jgi:hypothetical protein